MVMVNINQQFSSSGCGNFFTISANSPDERFSDQQEWYRTERRISTVWMGI